MQVNGSVNVTAGFLLAGDQVAVENGVGKNADNLDFASFLAQPQKGADKAVPKVSEKKETQQSVCPKESSDNVATQERDSNEPVESPNTAGADTVKREAVVVSDEKQEMVEVDEVQISELIGNLFQMITDQLELPVQDLQEALKAFGMEPVDLLTTDGLKEIFLNVKAVDVSDLIVDEDLNLEFQDLAQRFHDIFLANDVKEESADLLASNEDIIRILEETAVTQDVEEFAPPPVAQTKEKEQLKENAEPEVIVDIQTDKRRVPVGAARSQNESAMDEEPGHAEKIAPEKEIHSVRRESFSHPVLEPLKEAVDRVETPEFAEQPVQETDIVNQVVEQIRVNMNRTTTSLQLQLYPEHLGKIQINVVSKDGVMTARIVAETENARQAIEGGLANLKEAMEGQDLKVDAIEVMVSTAGFERGDEEQGSFEQERTAKGRRKLNLSDLEEEPEEETAELEKMKQAGSSVSYTA